MSGPWLSGEAFPFGGAEVVAKVGGKRRGGQMENKKEGEVMIAGQDPAAVGEAAGAAAKEMGGKRHGGQEAGKRRSRKAGKRHGGQTAKAGKRHGGQAKAGKRHGGKTHKAGKRHSRKH
jgi:hypothetical protein